MHDSIPVLGDTENVFRSLYRRVPGHYLAAIPQAVFADVTVDECARSCVNELAFECQSFDVDNLKRECHLHNHTHRDPGIGLQYSPEFDHYRTAYEKLFHRIPNHVITLRHNRNIRGLDVEQCARRCILEIGFRCQGFDFERRGGNCWLTELTVHDVSGLTPRPHTDFYERKSNGPISRFINYGHGGLQTVEGVQTHNKIVLGVNLDACAQLCLAETSFSCESFDYVFSEQSCQLSQYIAANVYGIRTVFEPGYRVMHYELIGEYQEHFYPTPYASVPGRNDRELRKVTPETCARKCLQEKEFVCRSFDYQIQRGTCLLSHVTGSDAGGLYTPEGVGVHHFEMKPTLDCGGSLAGERGGLASPNWPRNYLHHLNCTWTISVQAHKIIRLSIHHLDLGWRPGDWCSHEVDSLTVTEVADQGRQSTCIDGESRELSTITNTASVNFVTNSDRDAQGFRIFYTADWPCNTTYMDDQGQFASPRWPGMYPANSACNWTLVAPFGGQVMLRFTSVKLEDHTASSCRTAYDKIQVYDVVNTTSNLVRTLCGTSESTIITSNGNIVSVVFTSDNRVQAEGFHATYTFILPTTTSSTTTTSTTSTAIPKVTTQSPYVSVNQHANKTSIMDTNDDVQTNNTVQVNIKLKSENISSSIKLAMTGDSNDNKNHDVIKLTAIFVEPDMRNEFGDKNNSVLFDGETGDDIGRNVPDVTRADTGSRDTRAIFVGVLAAFVSMVAVMMLALLFACRYYSAVPEAGFVDEDDVDEAARLPLPW
ncbi:CUBN-like protein [Mya arenaria]|uniref:CUBN-like protein n=1 Tax=Mya arenaria TaxID=6604 RepID=A0ABY7GAI6_MYAAR|nr:CUBN-like protein [Mya arenaria]